MKSQILLGRELYRPRKIIPALVYLEALAQGIFASRSKSMFEHHCAVLLLELQLVTTRPQLMFLNKKKKINALGYKGLQLKSQLSWWQGFLIPTESHKTMRMSTVPSLTPASGALNNSVLGLSLDWIALCWLVHRHS